MSVVWTLAAFGLSFLDLCQDPWTRPKLSFAGKATYSVLGSDLDAKLVWQDQDLQEYAFEGEQEIRPSQDESERLTREPTVRSYVASHWFIELMAGTFLQVGSVWLGWIRKGSKIEPVKSVPSTDKVWQSALSISTLLLLVLSNSSATRFLTRHFFERPKIEIVKYSIPGDVFGGTTAGGCAVWGFSIRTNAPVDELHLVANIEKKIFSQQVTDGSEFGKGDRFNPHYQIQFPCNLVKRTNQNSHLDDEVSSDRQQVIMYSPRFTRPDKGGILLSFYPAKEGEVLAFEWEMTAHYTDFFLNDQTLGTDDISMKDLGAN